MPAQSGRAFLLKISDDAASPAFTTVAGLRASSLVINSEAVDITHKGSGGWREILSGAGMRSVAMRGDGVFTDSAAEQAVQLKVMTGAQATCQMTFEDGARFEGPFHIASLEYGGDHNGARVYSVALESAGPISYFAA